MAYNLPLKEVTYLKIKSVRSHRKSGREKEVKDGIKNGESIISGDMRMKIEFLWIEEEEID